jgi:hypothetical protein
MKGKECPVQRILLRTYWLLRMSSSSKSIYVLTYRVKQRTLLRAWRDEKQESREDTQRVEFWSFKCALFAVGLSDEQQAQR